MTLDQWRKVILVECMIDFNNWNELHKKGVEPPSIAASELLTLGSAELEALLT